MDKIIAYSILTYSYTQKVYTYQVILIIIQE